MKPKINLGYAGGMDDLISPGLVKPDAVELSFTYKIMNASNAIFAGQLAKKQGIRLSIHAPFTINLASEKENVVNYSVHQLLECAERGQSFNQIDQPVNLVFHAAFYGIKSPDSVFGQVKQKILDIQTKLISRGLTNIKLCPETTGKPCQFGSLIELIRLSNETGCSMCIDFAHLLARDHSFRTDQARLDYPKIFRLLHSTQTLHTHFTGVIYSNKGELKHQKTEPTRIKELLDGLIRLYPSNNITIINESPDRVEDFLITKQILGGI